jgi:uncharacterized protein (TIGR02246 family)
MKSVLAVALTGLAISFTAPVFAQQKDSIDPIIDQQIRRLVAKYDEEYNKQDWTAVAALFTEHGISMTAHDGTFHGRQAIEKQYAKTFQIWHPNNIFKTVDRVLVVRNEARLFGRRSVTFKDDAYTRHVEGHFLWVLVREGDTWKIRKDDSHEESRSW